METIVAIISIGIMASVLIFVVSACNAFALTYLWRWFIIPLAPGQIPELTFWWAMGVAMVVSFLTKNYQQSSKDDDEANAAIKVVAGAILLPFICLFFGWLIHSCM